MSNNTNTGVILIGHGSRVPGASAAMERIASMLLERNAQLYDFVEISYMERLGPRLPDAMSKSAEMGAKKVIIIPYFLHVGLHIIVDLPTMVREEAKKYPGVNFIFGKTLGFDESTVTLVEKRIKESWEWEDIREVNIKSRNDYPIPDGQQDVVHMSIEEAEHYRNSCGVKNNHHGVTSD